MNRITLTEIDGLWYAEHNTGLLQAIYKWGWGDDIDTAIDRLRNN